MVQKLYLIGRMGREPELRYMPDGTGVATFPLATKRSLTPAQKAKTGLDEETTWFRVTCYGKTAEYLVNYAQKGSILHVEGRLVCDPTNGCPQVFQKKDGTWASSFDVSAESVRLITGYKNGGNQGQGQPTQTTNMQQPKPQQQQQPKPQQQLPIAQQDTDDIPW